MNNQNNNVHERVSSPQQQQTHDRVLVVKATHEYNPVNNDEVG